MSDNERKRCMAPIMFFFLFFSFSQLFVSVSIFMQDLSLSSSPFHHTSSITCQFSFVGSTHKFLEYVIFLLSSLCQILKRMWLVNCFMLVGYQFLPLPLLEDLWEVSIKSFSWNCVFCCVDGWGMGESQGGGWSGVFYPLEIVGSGQLVVRAWLWEVWTVAMWVTPQCEFWITFHGLDKREHVCYDSHHVQTTYSMCLLIFSFLSNLTSSITQYNLMPEEVLIERWILHYSPATVTIVGDLGQCTTLFFKYCIEELPLLPMSHWELTRDSGAVSARQTGCSQYRSTCDKGTDSNLRPTDLFVFC